MQPEVPENLLEMRSNSWAPQTPLLDTSEKVVGSGVPGPHGGSQSWILQTLLDVMEELRLEQGSQVNSGLA